MFLNIPSNVYVIILYYRCEEHENYTVSFDGGWQTRGSGRNYASLSGRANVLVQIFLLWSFFFQYKYIFLQKHNIDYMYSLMILHILVFIDTCTLISFKYFYFP